MLKNISKTGKLLSKKEQKIVKGNGGCFPFEPCDVGYVYDYTACACVPDNS